MHGQAVPLDGRDRLVVLDPPDEALLGSVASAAEAAGVAVSTVHEPADLHPLLAQIPLSVRGQMLALRMAEATGTDPDLSLIHI